MSDEQFFQPLGLQFQLLRPLYDPCISIMGCLTRCGRCFAFSIVAWAARPGTGAIAYGSTIVSFYCFLMFGAFFDTVVVRLQPQLLPSCWWERLSFAHWWFALILRLALMKPSCRPFCRSLHVCLTSLMYGGHISTLAANMYLVAFCCIVSQRHTFMMFIVRKCVSKGYSINEYNTLGTTWFWKGMITMGGKES